jgi:hypothetical protein
MSPTQLHRPTLDEASSEASLSPDSHWTASLSAMGMTRISRHVVWGLRVPQVVR